jgi:hypothetical protein
MQGLPDNLVRDMRAVEIGGIDMVHARGDGRAQDGDGAVRILGRTPYAGAGQLHCAIAYALDSQRGAGKREAAAE